jgi:prepilin-type processing-associated H-X9-DG protein/prepilin-type N-terminal cleavage/methylation domain-containing protein
MKSRFHRGFTLIELMVVIAIIMILFALMLPAFGSFRSRMRTVQCMNNMRQIAAAWALYAGDNHGKLVGSDYGRNSWDWLKQTGCNSDDTIRNGILYPYLNNISLYKCPEETVLKCSYSMMGILNDPWDAGAYWALTNSTGQTIPIYNVLETIPYPGRQALLVEESAGQWCGSVHENVGSFNWNPGISQAWTAAFDWPAWWRHNGTMNVAFCDGHVENWRATDPYSLTVRWEGQWVNVNGEDYKRVYKAVYAP